MTDKTLSKLIQVEFRDKYDITLNESLADVISDVWDIKSSLGRRLENAIIEQLGGIKKC